MSDYDLPVFPVDDLVLPDTDTTLTGTITMLSDKFQVLDIVAIEGDSAVRRGRISFDGPIQPYHGGIISARVTMLAEDSYGYMIRTHLLEWREAPLPYRETHENLERLVRQQYQRLERLLSKQGFEDWDFSGTLVPEGYDPARNISIYSMASRAVEEPMFERQPVLIVWATAKEKLVKVELAIIIRVLERSQM